MHLQNFPEKPEQSAVAETSRNTLRPRRKTATIHMLWSVATVLALVAGSIGGYLVGMSAHEIDASNSMDAANNIDVEAIVRSIFSEEGYEINVSLGEIGPALMAAGAFNLQDFVQVFERAGQPLSDAQMLILQMSSDENIVFNSQNAHFLLNLLWAFGVTNQNPILEEGPMVAQGHDQIGNFASTGGWVLAQKPIQELYSSAAILKLTESQQRRLEEVAQAVYRPCCNNPTNFPDCNHGMAMLGLLEIMAANDASVDEMFEAAKYANAYWYPRQTVELAAYFQIDQDSSFEQVDSRKITGKHYASVTGYQGVRSWMASYGLTAPNQSGGGGSSCGIQ